MKKFINKHKNVLLKVGTQGMAKLSLAVVYGLFAIANGPFNLAKIAQGHRKSSAPRARKSSFFGALARIVQHVVGLTPRARMSSQLRAEHAIERSVHSTPRARLLSGLCVQIATKTNQCVAGLTHARPVALSQLRTGSKQQVHRIDSTPRARLLSRFGVFAGQIYRVSSTSRARALSLLGIFAVIVSIIGGVLIYRTDSAQAATSDELNFQGRLLTNTGGLVPDGTYNMEFNLYYVSSGGTSQWTEDRLNTNTQGVTVRNGYFSVYLGSLDAFPGTIDWSQDLYLGMTVRGTGSCAWGACTPADTEMTPRFKLTSVPYAFRAANVASSDVDSADSDDVSITTGDSTTSGTSGDIIIDTGAGATANGGITLGATNASSILIGRAGINTNIAGSLTVDELTTLNGGLTVQAGDTFTFNGDGFTDFTGGGLYNNAGVLSVDNTILDDTFFAQNGNSFGAAAVLGTNDAFDLSLETNGTTRFTVSSTAATLSGNGVTTLSSSLSLNLRTNDSTAIAQAINLLPGAGTGGIGTGGSINLTGGNGSVGGGGITLQAGSQSVGATGLSGGVISIVSPNGLLSTTSNINITGGNSGSARTEQGGSINITGGDSDNITSRAGDISIVGGAGTGASANSDGGNITIDGGTSTSGSGGTISLGSANASALTIGNSSAALTVNSDSTFTGNLTVQAGNLFTNAGATLFTAITISNDVDGGVLGSTAAATVDIATTLNVNQTTASQTFTLASPTTTTSGRILYVNNVGSASFTLEGNPIAAGESASYIWNGTSWVQTISFTSTGVDTIGALDGGTANANGAFISGTTIFLQSASATYAGLVNTGTQTFAGAKTFSDSTLTIGNNGSTGATLVLADAAGQTAAVYLGAGGGQGRLQYTDAGVLQLFASGASKLEVDFDSVDILAGVDLTVGGNTSLGDAATDTTTIRGQVTLSDSSATYPLIFGADVSLYRGGADLLVTPDSLTVSEDLSVNGGDIVTSQTTFNLLNTTVTTLNVGGAATTLEIGAATGTTSINNSLSVDGTIGVATLGTADTSTYLCRNSSNIISGCLVSPISSTLADNVTDAFDLQEGTNNYININTTNGSEEIQFGNTTTNPVYSFLGSGTVNFASSLRFSDNYNDRFILGADNNSGDTASITVVTGNSNANAATSGDLNLFTGDGTGTGTNSGNISIDTGSATGTAGTISLGATNASAITLGRTGITTTNAGALTVTGLTTLNGGLTVEAGDTFTFNGDAFTDFTGGGLVNTGGVLTVDATSATGFFQNGGNSFSANAVLGTNDAYDLSFEVAGNTVATFDNTDGSLLLQNSTDSTSAFQVQNAAGTSLFTVDTTGSGAATFFNGGGDVTNFTTESTTLPTDLLYGATVTYNGYFYVIAGEDIADTNPALDDVYVAQINSDGSIGSFTATTSLPATRVQHQAVVMNGRIYVIGGSTHKAGTPQSTVYYADINGDGTISSWNTTTAIPAGRMGFSLVAANNYIYVIAGYASGNETSPQSTVYYAYVNPDGSISSWNSGTSLPAARGLTNAIEHNNYIYAIGGDNSGATPTDTVYYAPINPSTGVVGSWTLETDTIPTALRAAAVTEVNGYIYLLGGGANVPPWTSYDEISYVKLNADGSTGAWTTSPKTLPGAVRGHMSTSYGNTVYVAGGYANGGTNEVNTIFSSTVGGQLTVNGGLRVNGVLESRAGIVAGSLDIQGGANINGNLGVLGDLIVNGNDIVSDGNLTVNANGYVRIGDAGTPGIAVGDDDLYVEGDVEIDGVLAVAGATTIDNILTINGGTITDTGSAQVINVSLGNDGDNDVVAGLQINATTQDTGDVDILAGLFVNNLSGTAGTTGNAAILIGSGWENEIGFTDTTARISVPDILRFTDATSGGGNNLLTIDVNGTVGDVGVTGALTVNGTGTFNGNVVVGNANTDTLTINAGTSGSGITFADASFQNCVLTTNGSGVLTCAASGSIVTLQAAYTGGNTILATNAEGDIDLTVSEATNFSVDITGTGSFLVQDSGTNVLSIADGGATIFRNTTDTTSGFKIQDADGGTSIFNVDTTNERVGIGVDTPANILDVVGAAASGSYIMRVQNTTNGGEIFQGVNYLGNSVIELNTAGGGAGVFIMKRGNGLSNTVYLFDGAQSYFDISQGFGVGTTSPAAILEAQADIGDNLTALRVDQLDTTNNNVAVDIQNAGTGNSLQVNTNQFVIASGGATTLQNASNSSNGFRVNNAAGSSILNVDTSNFAVDLASTRYQTVTNATCGVNCTITQANVDTNAAIIVEATVGGLDITLPDPTDTTAGRLVYITAANGSEDFTLIVNGGGVNNEIAMRENTTATMIWNGSDWTAAGASSSTTLQAAYNNTLTSAGGAEIVLNNTATSNGLTVRNNATTPIIGSIFEAQTSVGSNLFSVNNNSVEYAVNGGAENAFSSGWSNTPGGGTVTRYTTQGNYIATGVGSVEVVTTGSGSAGQGAENTLSTSLTANLRYSVSFAVRGTTSFNTLDVYYSPDGTTTGEVACTTGITVTQGKWTRVICTFDAPASGITASNSIFIRQSDSNTTARTYYVENLSVTVKADVNHAADGDVDSAGNFTTNWTATGSATASYETSIIYNTSGSAQTDTTAAIGDGIRNNLSIAPDPNTQYLVTFYAQSSNTFNDIRVRYSRDGGTSFVSCTDYNTQSVSTSSWTQITCLFTTDGTTATNADLFIDQPTATARTFYIDGLEVTLNENTANNVQIGGGNLGGPTTLFTLDRSAGAPVGANNDAYLGSMYYDTVTGRIQCYEAGGWGTCGAPPDNIVNLNPEYAGSVLNGGGIGTMQADVCANESGVLQVNSTLCGSGEARSFYTWTSPQATQQTYSIYVTYQLPSTFDGFASDDTVTLTGRVSNTSNAAVTYEMFRSESGSITKCGTGETTVATTANTWQTVGINGNEATGCGFTSNSANAFVIFKINLKANSNADAYVSTLSFTTTGR